MKRSSIDIVCDEPWQLVVQFCVERVDGFVDDVVRVRGVVEEVTAVFGGWVVDEASRVVELG